MDPSTALAQQLSSTVSSLTDDAVTAVPSVLAVVVTLAVDGHDVSLSSSSSSSLSSSRPDELVPGAPAASLHFPLAAIAPALAGRVTFFASAPGAFVDLAADLCHALGLDDREVRLDDHLGIEAVPGVAGARELSSINRAVGFLMGRGWTQESARDEIELRAIATGQRPYDVAGQLLATRSDPTGHRRDA